MAWLLHPSADLLFAMVAAFALAWIVLVGGLQVRRLVARRSSTLGEPRATKEQA